MVTEDGVQSIMAPGLLQLLSDVVATARQHYEVAALPDEHPRQAGLLAGLHAFPCVPARDNTCTWHYTLQQVLTGTQKPRRGSSKGKAAELSSRASVI